jgi:hypothetical protein
MSTSSPTSSAPSSTSTAVEPPKPITPVNVPYPALFGDASIVSPLLLQSQRRSCKKKLTQSLAFLYAYCFLLPMIRPLPQPNDCDEPVGPRRSRSRRWNDSHPCHASPRPRQGPVSIGNYIYPSDWRCASERWEFDLGFRVVRTVLVDIGIFVTSTSFSLGIYVDIHGLRAQSCTTLDVGLETSTKTTIRDSRISCACGCGQDGWAVGSLSRFGAQPRRGCE